MIEGSYDPIFVLLSVLLAVLTSYAAFGLVSRVAVAEEQGFLYRLWLTGGGFAMGGGIWAMHFTGILAYKLPVPVHYDSSLTLISLLIAMAVSGWALHTASHMQPVWSKSLLAGLFMCAGIVAMHYIGMSAVHLPARHIYDPWLVTLSIMISIAGFAVMLRMLAAFHTTMLGSRLWQKIGAACVMGLLISAIHYVGMAAISFEPKGGGVIHNSAIAAHLLAGIIVGIALFVQLAALIAILVDQMALSRQVRVQLAESEEKFRSVLNGVADIIFMLGKHGRILEANDVAMEGLGYSKDELLRMGIADIAPDLPHNLTATQRFTQTKLHNQASYETFYRAADGSPIPVEVVSTSAEIGGQRVTLAVARDITQRQETEDRLRKLSQAVEQAGEAIVISDRHGAIEYINPAFTKVTGYTFEDVKGENPRFLKSGHQDDAFYEEMWQTISNGKVWNRSLIDRRKDGSLYPALMSIAPIRGSNGKISHYVGIQQDMSEQAALEDQLRQAQKMEAMGTLVGGIAHDFNNMLAGITGNIFVAKEGIADRPDALERLEAAEELGFRAADMVSQLMTFARKDKITMKSLDFTAFMKEAFNLSRVSIPENISLTASFPDDDLIVRGDKTQLQQGLMNLLNNAHDALRGRRNPAIKVTVEAYEANAVFLHTYPDKGRFFAHLMVEDNGAGIEREDLGRIFEPFFTTKGVGDGTGLGLSMVYGMVHQHGGILDVESRKGEGTIFHIYLPLLYETTHKSSVIEPQKPVMGEGETILLVDDDAGALQAGKNVLESLGYMILTATNGEEAVQIYAVEHSNIDLVMLDVVMPKIGGVKAARLIHQINPKAKIIFATGYDRERALSLEGGIEDRRVIIGKPYHIEKLSQIIRDVLKRDT